MRTLHWVAVLAASSTLLGLSAVPPIAASEHCAVIATPAATPLAGDVAPASPVAHNPEQSPEQLYIDMMIPHHVSIIALAETALPSLDDDRLRDIATAIVATQQAEIDELREMRAARFGSPDPVPLADDMMAVMHVLMPDKEAAGHDMEAMRPDMEKLMDSAALVDAYCQSNDPDLTFANLTLAHHEMAVDSSRGLLEMTHDAELRDLAERVIAAQEAEIATLQQVLDEHGAASPTP
jgi:uncharacterized protein (DUF305 family)